MILQLVPADVHRALEPLVDVCRCLVVLLGTRERSEVRHYSLDPLGSVDRLTDERLYVVYHELNFVILGPGVEFMRQLLSRGNVTLLQALLHAQASSRKLPDVHHVVAQRIHIGVNETDGVVDLVRHPCGQLADGSHLLGLEQLAVRLLQFAVVLFRPGVGCFQVACPLLGLGVERAEHCSQFALPPGRRSHCARQLCDGRRFRHARKVERLLDVRELFSESGGVVRNDYYRRAVGVAAAPLFQHRRRPIRQG